MAGLKLTVQFVQWGRILLSYYGSNELFHLNPQGQVKQKETKTGTLGQKE